MPGPRRSPTSVTSLLIVRLGAVGDVIRTLPLLHALRRDQPKARIGWLVEEPSADLLRAVEALDTVHVLPRRSLSRKLRRPWTWPGVVSELCRLRAELERARYEIVLDAHGTLKAALAAKLAGGELLVGLGPGGSKEGAHRLHDESIPFPDARMTRIRRALFLGREAGLLGMAELESVAIEHGLRFPPASAGAVRALMAERARPRIVLFPFASNTAKGRRKRWPSPLWAELAQLLRAGGASVLLAWGSPREGDEARAIAEQSGAAAELAPATDLCELAGLLEECELLITGDTGPMHLAAAVGTRCLALFGPSDPIVNRPWGEGHRVLTKVPLESLTAAEVAGAATEMLGASALGP